MGSVAGPDVDVRVRLLFSLVFSGYKCRYVYRHVCVCTGGKIGQRMFVLVCVPTERVMQQKNNAKHRESVCEFHCWQLSPTCHMNTSYRSQGQQR